jgi:hypothetical protein
VTAKRRIAPRAMRNNEKPIRMLTLSSLDDWGADSERYAHADDHFSSRRWLTMTA